MQQPTPPQAEYPTFQPAPPQPQYQQYPTHPENPPMGVPVDEPKPSPQVVIISREQPRMQCQNCKTHFVHHTQRYGISWLSLISIIVVSCFLPIMLFLFFCLCRKYPVCPNCGQFTGNPESNEIGICLC